MALSLLSVELATYNLHTFLQLLCALHDVVLRLESEYFKMRTSHHSIINFASSFHRPVDDDPHGGAGDSADEPESDGPRNHHASPAQLQHRPVQPAASHYRDAGPRCENLPTLLRANALRECLDSTVSCHRVRERIVKIVQEESSSSLSLPSSKSTFPQPFHPFTPKSDQFQISPAASPAILHHTV